jgi:toxin-antitoxin system PIN domain toxin
MPAMDEHAAARRWLAGALVDPDGLVGLCWPVLYGFTRLVTSRRIMGDDAVPLAGAWAAAETFLDHDAVRLVEAGPSHGVLARELMSTPGLSSDDVPDVQLAALAIEHGLTLCTHDRGFARFDRLTWMDPLDR